jgi:hypothetical protein
MIIVIDREPLKPELADDDARAWRHLLRRRFPNSDVRTLDTDAIKRRAVFQSFGASVRKYPALARELGIGGER